MSFFDSFFEILEDVFAPSVARAARGMVFTQDGRSYVCTGEWRQPRPGEWHLCGNGPQFKLRRATARTRAHACSIWTSFAPQPGPAPPAPPADGEAERARHAMTLAAALDLFGLTAVPLNTRALHGPLRDCHPEGPSPDPERYRALSQARVVIMDAIARGKE